MRSLRKRKKNRRSPRSLKRKLPQSMRSTRKRLKRPEDISRIRESGRVLAGIFRSLAELNLDGMTTWDIDAFIEHEIFSSGARPAFKTVAGYNSSSCISVNTEVVHGIPSKKKRLAAGDIVKIDIGVAKNGFFSDACHTYPVGEITDGADRLITATRDSLHRGIAVMYPGNRVGDIGHAIQQFIESLGYSVVRSYTGHGVGFGLHEPPAVPHFGGKGTGPALEPGLVLAVEPIVNEGSHEVTLLKDGWTAVTSDGSMSAQFEHTVAVTEHGPLVLTD